MKEPKFKIGDKVRVIASSISCERGNVFTVKYIQRSPYDALPHGYSDNPHVPDDSSKKVVKVGFVVLEDELELVAPDNTGKILIMVDEKDPDKIIARDLITNKTAEAKRNPKDDWDFAKGAKLALERLTEPEKPKYWTGKVVCIKTNGFLGNVSFTVGQVYKVDNGLLYDNLDDRWFSNNEIKSFEELNGKIGTAAEFIEYKGGAE